MEKSPFIFELFESHNTCIQQRVPIVGRAVNVARETAKRLSLKYHHVIVSLDGEQWEEYTKAEKTAWSYPNGIENSI